MNREAKELVLSTKAEVVLLDIDGTLKDLVKEHTATLRVTVNGFTRGKELRRNLVFFLDKIAMGFVKGGLLSTNHDKRDFLLNLYAFILGKNMREFRNLYDVFYKEKVIIFKGVKSFLNQLSERKRVYLVTTNEQNFNLECIGIKKEDIVCVGSKDKVYAYKSVMMMHDLDPEEVLVVGDNYFDDIKPAKRLGCNYLLVDNYKSKWKRCLAKILNVGIV